MKFRIDKLIEEVKKANYRTYEYEGKIKEFFEKAPYHSFDTQNTIEFVIWAEREDLGREHGPRDCGRIGIHVDRDGSVAVNFHAQRINAKYHKDSINVLLPKFMDFISLAYEYGYLEN